jgi:hypothetical protein
MFYEIEYVVAGHGYDIKLSGQFIYHVSNKEEALEMCNNLKKAFSIEKFECEITEVICP